MQDETEPLFDQQKASVYDENFARLAPMRDTLQFVANRILSSAPERARILCVGAGTGAEIRSLAAENPLWEFVAVDPSAPMLAICREHAEREGFLDRCTFHEGYLETLPETELFDGATSILVSHFIMDKGDRQAFFTEIAKRLKPGGYLVNADLALAVESEQYQSLKETWKQLILYAGFTAEEADANLAMHDQKVAMLPLKDVASLMASAGFASPTLFYQCVFIHGWFARRKE